MRRTLTQRCERSLSRRGQIIGQVFIFVIGAFVVSAVLLIGYKAIANLQEQQCATQEAEFARDIQTAFDTGLSRGKVRTHTFSLPCGTTEVCFVERSAIDGKVAGSPGFTDKTIIANSITEGESASVWVRDTKGYRKIDGIASTLPIADFGTGGSSLGVQCFAGTNVPLRFDGRGLTVFVTEDS